MIFRSVNSMYNDYNYKIPQWVKKQKKIGKIPLKFPSH